MSDTFFNSIDRISPGSVILDGDSSSSFVLTNPLPEVIFVDGNFSGTVTVTLPDMNLVNSPPLGTSIKIQNDTKVSTGNVIVFDSTLGQLLDLKQEQYGTIDLYNNITAEGNWIKTNYQRIVNQVAFNTNLSGPWAAPINVNLTYQVINNMVSIFIPQTVAQVTTSTFITNDSALTADLRPSSTQQGSFVSQFNPSPLLAISRFELSSAGIFKFYGTDSGSNYPISIGGGILNSVINYFID